MTHRSQPVAFGVDLGGTSARVAAVDREANILAFERTPTARIASGDRFLAWLRNAIESIISELAIPLPFDLPVGVAIAGLVDCTSGTVTRSINLPFLQGWPLAIEIEHVLGTSIVVMSDAEAATWGEFFMCKPAPKRFVHLRIGTGVALGVIIDGCFEDIEPGRTTHAKLLIVDDSASAALCRCGLSGCLETIASGTILAARTGELGLGESVEALDRIAREGHSEAVAIIERVAAAISRAIERVVLHYEPETICLGGGLVERMPFLAQAIRRATGRDADTSDQWPSLEAARLGDEAGVIGAAISAWRADRSAS